MRRIGGNLPARHSAARHETARQQNIEKWPGIGRVANKLYAMHGLATVLALPAAYEIAEKHTVNAVSGLALLGSAAVHLTARSLTKDYLNDWYLHGRQDEVIAVEVDQAANNGQNSGDTVQ